MFQNAKFFVVRKAVLEGKSACFPDPNARPRSPNCYYFDDAPKPPPHPVLQQQCQIIPTTEDETNHKSCKNLETRLTELLPRDKWGIKIEFVDFTWSPRGHDSTQIMRPGNVLLSGDILKELHSLMLYNSENSRFRIKLSADLKFGVFGAGRTANSASVQTLTSIEFKTELIPLMEDGRYNHSKYSSNREAPVTSLECKDFSRASFSLGLANLNVWIEGTEYDLSHVKQAGVMEGQKILLETGLGSDLTIVNSDNEAIPCHKIILMAQSSVMQTMLQDGKYKEAQTGEISMKDRTKEEVLAFLAFLYLGDLEKTLEDTTLGVTLFEMGHYYDVQKLEKAMKPVLLSRPADSFNVEVALRLFSVACGSVDQELKQKAADVLEVRNNSEIFEAPLFGQLSAPVIRELFAMSRRKF